MRRPVVLLVEDSPDDLALMRLAIAEARNPFEVVVVTDGQQALDWVFSRGAQAERDDQVYPALILLDWKLPLLSGQEVLQALRADPLGRHIPVVVLTTSEMPSDIARAFESGANAYLQKPMNFSDLVSLVEAIQGFWLAFNVLHPDAR
jgi:two-component system response regulator